MITGTGLFFVGLFATHEYYSIRRRCSHRALLPAKSG